VRTQRKSRKRYSDTLTKGVDTSLLRPLGEGRKNERALYLYLLTSGNYTWDL
jgi:hypothetical protein